MDMNHIREIFERHPGEANQLANRLGVPRSLVSMILSGQRRCIRGKSREVAEAIQQKAAELLAEEHRIRGGSGKTRKRSKN